MIRTQKAVYATIRQGNNHNTVRRLREAQVGDVCQDLYGLFCSIALAREREKTGVFSVISEGELDDCHGHAGPVGGDEGRDYQRCCQRPLSL